MRGLQVSTAWLLFLTAAPASGQAPVVEIDTVEVTVASRASRSAALTRSVETIPGDALRRLPAASVTEALSRVLGLDLMPRSPALADVAIRGSSFEQVLVMVDGVRVSDAQTGHFSLNLTVPLEQVERVEVLRGGGSAIHGADAMGGAINIVTRGGRRGSSVSVESGSFGTLAAAASHALSAGRFDLDVAGDLRRADGHRQGTDYETGTLSASAGAMLGGHRVRASVGHALREFGANGFYGPYDSFEETRTTTAALGWEAPSASGSTLGARVSARRNADHFILVRDDPALYENRHSTLQLGGEITGRYALSRYVRVAGVVESYTDRLESASLGDRSETRSAAGAEVVAGRAGNAIATAGLRADWHEAHGVVASPSVSAAWWPVRPLRLRAAASRSFRTPSWTDRYYSDPSNIGDPDLEPERAWTAELGAGLDLPGGVALSATGFVRDAEDLIDWARPANDSLAPFTIRNVESARFTGVELEAVLAEALGTRWTAGASLLSVSSSAEAGYSSKYALRPLTETVSISAERTVLESLGLAAHLRHARRRGDGDTYMLLDARASYTLGGARLYVDARNLLDEAHADVTGRPAPRRALAVGVALGR